MTTLFQKLAPPISSALQHPWVESIVRLSAVEDTLQALHPVLSLTQVRARVVRIEQETPTTKTFVLQANALWQPAQAGQFVRVGLEINGRHVERAYSLSSRPGASKLAITVKRQATGLVSQHLHDAAKVGDVLSLSQAEGDFVLPRDISEVPQQILLLSAGSGITPVMAMLRHLKASKYTGDVTFLNVCRSAEEFIFAKTLEQMQAEMPNLKLIKYFTQDNGHLTADKLRTQVPDLDSHATWLCGPQAMMQTIQTLWSEEQFAAPLYTERFTAAPLHPAVTLGAPVSVMLARSGKSFKTEGSGALLIQAESAGLSPKHGCRIGICRSCQCTKKSGTVQNLQTGEVSSAPNEQIRLCISVARSDIALDL